MIRPEWAVVGLGIALLVISLGLHEAAHAWVALKCGDPTGRDQGRITWNPIVHIDPLMTIILPAFLYFQFGFLFGGAKPVPVNFYNLRRPYRDMALVAFAGPATNFLLAILFFLMLKVVVIELAIWDIDMVGPRVLQQAVYFNLLLAVFNLIPIPPLDGSRIMAWLLPESLREGYHQMGKLGMPLIFLLVFFVPSFGSVLWQTIYFLWDVVEYGVTLGGTW